MMGPVSLDLDVRKLPDIPPRVGFEKRRLMRHPRSDTSATQKEQEEHVDILEDAPSAPQVVDEAFALRDAAMLASAQTPPPSIAFDGFDAASSGCACVPPDTDGDIGRNHYIQSVNSSIKIFDKSNGGLLAQTSYNSLFAGLGASVPCGKSENDGDGTVFYDHLADRWVVSDFAFAAFPGTSFYQCIGVSKTSDPVGGGWYLYAIQVDPSHPNYLGDTPKFGFWPDGYYLTMNEFSNTSTFNGVRVYALDRKSMVQGLAANAIGFSIDPATLGDQYSLMPATFRFGAPPAGAAEYLLSVNSPGGAGISETEVFAYRFHADFTTPANSTFGSGVGHGPNAIFIVNGFVEAFTNTGTFLVPQTGTTANLDTQGDRLMYPVYYQNLNGAESLWASHTVFASGTSGATAIRWYQFDVTGGTAQTTPAQQQTYSNGSDGLYRFMPSLALDSRGNLAINYSVSGSAVNPSIRYATRKPTDPANNLAQGEALLVQGAGHQTLAAGRWGDYSSIGADSADGCSFWMTNEYYSATSSTTWNTRIAAFSFPDCSTIFSDGFEDLTPVLLISQVQTRGEAGGNDEFVELYNPGANTVVFDNSWTLLARSSTAPGYTSRFVGANQLIPPHRHILIGGSTYNGSVAADASLSTGITDATSLVLQHNGGNVDALCFYYDATTQASFSSGYTCEGTPVSNLPHNDSGAGNTDVSLERKPGGASGNAQDTDDNSADFNTAVSSDPHNLASPAVP